MAGQARISSYGIATVILLCVATGVRSQIQGYCPYGSTPQYQTGSGISLYSLYPQSCSPWSSYTTCALGYTCQSAGYGYSNQYYCCSTPGVYSQTGYGSNYLQTGYANQYCPIGTSDYIIGMAQTYGGGTTMCSYAGQSCAAGYSCQYGVSGGLYCCSTRYGLGIGKK
uniref:Uncharacterized protein n=1 Tax=Plectus sambesii TaxID=2011161 RepID=A0A914WEV9_9BILA